MKRNLLIGLLAAGMLIPVGAKGADYLPLVSKDYSWRYVSSPRMLTLRESEKYVFDGEKTVDGKTYTMLKRVQDYDTHSDSKYQGVKVYEGSFRNWDAKDVEEGYLLREEGGVVYMLLEADRGYYNSDKEAAKAGTEIVVLDFTKEAGETFSTLVLHDMFDAGKIAEVKVVSTEKREIAGKERKVLKVERPTIDEDREKITTELVEGMGYTVGAFMFAVEASGIAGNAPCSLETYAKLNGEVLYTSPYEMMYELATDAGLTDPDRVWEYYSEPDKKTRRILRYRVEGEEEHAGKKYSRLVNFQTWTWNPLDDYKEESTSTETVALLRQDGQKVYRLAGEGFVDGEGKAIDKDKEYLLYDFSLGKGEVLKGVSMQGNVLTEKEYTVEDVTYTIIGENYYPVQTLSGEKAYRMAGGIGMLGEGTLAYTGKYEGGYAFNGVYGKDGKCLNEDFEPVEAPKTVGVTEAAAESLGVVSSEYYDLTGNRLASPAKGVSVRVDHLSNGTLKASKVMR